MLVAVVEKVTVVKNYNLYIELTSSIAALVVISCGSDCVSVIRSDRDNLDLGYSEHCGTVEPPLKRIREPANPRTREPANGSTIFRDRYGNNGVLSNECVFLGNNMLRCVSST